MKKKKCALFLFNGFADWEPALVIAGLNKFSDFAIHTFSADGATILSMGGVTVQPQHSFAGIADISFDLLILPGGDAWERGGNLEIIPLVEIALARQRTIAAICAATTLLANQGLLDNIPHTSNSLEYLKKNCPKYRGEKYYLNKPCIASGNIITANGAAMIEFAHEIYRAFGIFDADTSSAVLDLYKSGGMDNRLYA